MMGAVEEDWRAGGGEELRKPGRTEGKSRVSAILPLRV